MRLSSLLQPLGQYREKYLTPSKGSRHKRRRKKQKEAKDEKQPADQPARRPPAPALEGFVDVGLRSISRSLESASATASQQEVEVKSAVEDVTGTTQPSSAIRPAPPYAAIFVARSGHSSAFCSHYPQMVAVASTPALSSSSSAPADDSISEPIRLVGFSKKCEDRLAACLSLPHASAVGLKWGALEHVPAAAPLVELVRKAVSPVGVKWLEETRQGKHRRTVVIAEETKIGEPARKRRKK